MPFWNNNIRSICLSRCVTEQVRRCAHEAKNKRYRDTLNLPKTKFPLSMKDGVVIKRELKIQKVEILTFFNMSNRYEYYYVCLKPGVT